MKSKIMLLFSIFVILFVGCDINDVNDPLPQAELYHPPSSLLEIAIVGKVPFDSVRNVNYISKNLKDIVEDPTIHYDGLIITKDYLAEAAKQEYRDFFSNLTYPVFFMGTENLLAKVFLDDRLTLDAARIDGFGANVSGFVLSEGKHLEWGLYLPDNPTEADKDINMILRISNILEDFKRKRNKGLHSD